MKVYPQAWTHRARPHRRPRKRVEPILEVPERPSARHPSVPPRLPPDEVDPPRDRLHLHLVGAQLEPEPFPKKLLSPAARGDELAGIVRDEVLPKLFGRREPIAKESNETTVYSTL